jgi:hypothetical protein
MKKSLLTESFQTFVGTAVVGLLFLSARLHAQTADTLLNTIDDQSFYPQILVQPVDQAVLAGATAVLSVQAGNADGYQWLRNGSLLEGQTNEVLSIPSVQIEDVGLYSCQVFHGNQTVPTRTASLCVEVIGRAAGTSPLRTASAGTATLAAASGIPGGGPIVIYGPPLAGGGSSGSCPGRFTGYVLYSKPVSQGWGWTPISGVAHSITDTNRTNTKILYMGYYGDIGCARTTVSIPSTYSPIYEFAVYFTNNVPTNAYPIVLSGFNL